MKWTLIACAVLAAACPALAQLNPSVRPTSRELDCTTSGCHAKQLDHQFLHGPTAVKACDACHEYADPAKHTFALKRPGQQLCNFCHIDKTGREGPVVHKPVATGECTSCHDPHGSRVRQMLVKDTVPQLCLSCHKDEMRGAHAHKPAAEDCTACHTAHTSTHAKLLVAESKELCIGCHKPVGDTIETSRFGHGPAVSGDCVQCHSPHASDHEKGLKMAPLELCTFCHKDVGQQAASATHPHGAMSDARACLNCHAPHGSDHAKLLPKDTAQVCLDCHNKPIKVDKDKTVIAVSEVASPTLFKHGPIQMGECGACHGVHGASLPNLLVANYSTEFYPPHTGDAFALCFKCHDQRLAQLPAVGTETGFRNGNRNLHWVHVSKSNPGRSCRACHTPHASKSELMLAESVAYGQWSLPINFKKLDAGGSCTPGCHKPQTYDRNAAPMPVVPGTTGAPGTSGATGPTGPTGRPAPSGPAGPAAATPPSNGAGPPASASR